ncbi:hypothetical protein PCC7424_3675 [Gloeothece citriformis PCC 7424]|uniref:Uncharacterized protein n=1 Tax=Gloeothece citriformis (strain PCC 7424) TaxID=65393 RepID=B7KHW1_GLOC7|nr:hypothetical protein [Gloeothece citriformis]ACK72058.1 hypothetical protein PCC7424_3675 [Gloeothece citriformis PCC 7424]
MLKKHLSRYTVLFLFVLLAMLFFSSSPTLAADCGDSLFKEELLTPQFQKVKERFLSLANSFQPDSNVDSIFEVTIEGKSIEDIEKIITDNQSNYFTPAKIDGLASLVDGFSQSYDSVDGEWKKTVKVTTINRQGNTITPYIQIFYEDNNGGVIRIKPYGNTDAPPNLTHLRKAHGTLYFKNDPNGDLSWENEAFKVYGNQPIPKSPKDVKLPNGIVYGSQQGEDFLAQCWTYYTHVPVDSIFD